MIFKRPLISLGMEARYGSAVSQPLNSAVTKRIEISANCFIILLSNKSKMECQIYKKICESTKKYDHCCFECLR